MDILKLTKEICSKYNIKPSRSKGQNFLIEGDVYDKIIASADLDKEDIVLEVGPGLGFLTERLAQIVKRVVAIELDDKLADVLKARLKEQGIKNVEVVNEDIIKFSIFNYQFSNNVNIHNSPAAHRAAGQAKFKIVANLPYNITSIFLRKFLSANPELGSGYPEQSSGSRLESMTLLLQKEVAERVTAKPGKMSLLAVSVQYYSEPEIIEYVPKNAFWPVPDVDSAIVHLTLFQTHPAPMRQGHPSQEVIFEKEFFRMVRIGFSARRKMLKNNLAGGYRISQEEAGSRIKSAGFSEKIRAQELSVGDWIKLFDYFK